VTSVRNGSTRRIGPTAGIEQQEIEQQEIEQP
jgi:hypothetical protein